MRITPIPFFVYELLISTMRCSQPLANGQWLQVKITSVPALPATSAIDTIFPSTFFIFAVAIGALDPSAIAPLPSAASAAGAASASARLNPIEIRSIFMASSVVMPGATRRRSRRLRHPSSRRRPTLSIAGE